MWQVLHVLLAKAKHVCICILHLDTNDIVCMFVHQALSWSTVKKNNFCE